MKMKKTGTLILTAAVAASLFAGCSQTTETSGTAAAPASETTAAATLPSETTTTETEQQFPGSAAEFYGDQIMNYLDHQYYFNGQPVPIWVSNHYILEVYNKLSEYASSAGIPVTTLGFIDLAAEYPGEEFDTYGDYVISEAEDTIESRCIWCLHASEEGLTLSDESYAKIDADIEGLKSTLAQYDMTLDEYLLIWEAGIDETEYRKVKETESLANEYIQFYYLDYQVPQIRYVFFPATDADEQTVKDAASNAANEMKNACENDLEKLPGLAETAKNAGTNLDYGDLSITYEEFPINLEEWAWSEERAVGDLDIVLEPDLGYFIVGYLGTTADTEKANTAFFSETYADIEANTYDFHTDEPYLPAPAAPTATPVPETAQTEPSAQVSFDPNATSPTTPSGNTAPLSNAKTNDVIAVVLYTLAGVAIAAVVVLLIAAAVKKSKNAPDKSEAFDDEEDDESETEASESDEDEEDKEVDEDDGE